MAPTNYTIETGVREHEAFILKQCLYFAKKADAADSLRGEVYEKVCKGRHTFNGKAEDFRKWISVVIRHTYVDLYRAEKAAKRSHFKADVNAAAQLSSGENVLQRMQDKERLDAVLFTIENHLPYPILFRKIFEAKFLLGLNYQEIAQDVNESVDMVKSTVFKIRKFLQKPGSIKTPTSNHYEYTRIYTPRAIVPVVYGLRPDTRQTFFEFG